MKWKPKSRRRTGPSYFVGRWEAGGALTWVVDRRRVERLGDRLDWGCGGQPSERLAGACSPRSLAGRRPRRS